MRFCQMEKVKVRQAAYRYLLRKIGAERVGRGLVSRHQAEPKALGFGHRTAWNTFVPEIAAAAGLGL